MKLVIFFRSNTIVQHVTFNNILQHSLQLIYWLTWMSFGKADAEQKKANITTLIRQTQTDLLEDKSSTLTQKGSRYGTTLLKTDVFQAPLIMNVKCWIACIVW